MNESPIMTLVYVLAAGYILHLWWQDKKRAEAGETVKGALPGASGAPLPVIVLGVVGALILVALETGGELLLGVSDEQSTLPWWFLATMVAAGVVEEVIFRGYLISLRRGALLTWVSILGFSALFALLHPHLWAWEVPEEGSFWEGQLTFSFTAKAWFTTSILFVNSVWFYFLRILPGNTTRSLLPCFAAHIASNVGVYGVKLAQGFIAF